MNHKLRILACILAFTMVALATVTVTTTIAEAVAVTVESRGAGNFGWNQSFSLVPTPDIRLTGSADRMFYDWGYKPIEIMGRRESFWATNCGWWYVMDGGNITIVLRDALGHIVLTNTSHTLNLTRDKGMFVHRYVWRAGDDPGRWTVTVSESSGVSVFFFIFVRGQLDVTSITVSPAPTAGNNSTIFAVLRDNAAALVRGNATHRVNVTAHVSGAGENFVFTMRDDGTRGDVTANDGTWSNNTFRPSRPGTYFITVSAGDGRVNWVDGSNSTKVGVGGAFMPAMMLIPILEQMDGAFASIPALASVSGIAMIFGAFVLGKRMMWK